MAFVWNGENLDNEDIYVRLVGSGTPLRLTRDPAADRSPVWSPDGREVAFSHLMSGDPRAAIRAASAIASNRLPGSARPLPTNSSAVP